MIIDFHSHILPGIDDGSPNLSCTEGLLRETMRQGVDIICATPHFYASHVSVHGFLERREAAFQRTRSMCREKGINIPIFCGAEVYFFPGMGEAEHLKELTLGGSDILLLEMPFGQWTEAVYQEVRKIVYRQQLRVVLAHLERYFAFQKKKEAWEKVLDLPVTIQLNAGCVNDRKKERFSRKVLASDFPVVLGSDCHNLDRRPPDLLQGREALAKRNGQARLDEIDADSRALISRVPGFKERFR